MFCAARVCALQHTSLTPLFNPSRANIVHCRHSSIRIVTTTLYGFSRQGGNRSKRQTQRPQRRSPQAQQPHPTQQVRRNSSKTSSNNKLEKPEIIFSNNHVLVVNKPAGWKSQPGDGGGQNNDNQ
eukprot:scaffold9608_cov99-Skeletonema_marinoi.AAC.1